MVVGITAAAVASANASYINGIYYPYGVISPVPYTYGYTVPTSYAVSCGVVYGPICATPSQMWSQSYADSEAAGNAIAAGWLMAS